MRVRQWSFVAAVVAVLGLVLASQCGAEPLKYQFKGQEEVVYEVTITADLPNAVETHSGRLTYVIKSVDPSNGQIALTYNAQLGTQTQAKQQEEPRRFPRPFPPMHNPFAVGRAAPEMLISPIGKVLRTNAFDDESNLPFMLGRKWQLMLPPLARDGGTTWKEEQDITLYTKRGGNAQQWPPPPPWERRAEERVDRPAHETVTYTLGQRKGSVVPITRQYAMETDEKAGDVPLTRQTTKTQFLFDMETGMVQSMELTGTIEVNQDNVAIRVPITASAKLLSAEEMAKIKAEREAAAAKARADSEQQRKWEEGTKNAEGKTIRTPALGLSGTNFARIDPALRPVIGVRFTEGDWGGRKCVRRVDPLYEKPTEPPGQGVVDVIARPGYAVGGLVVNMKKEPIELWAMQVIFMRLDNGKLVKAEQYRGPWVADLGNALPKIILGATGETVVGFYGRQGLNTDAIGLVLLDANAKAAEPEDPKEEPAAKKEEEGAAEEMAVETQAAGSAEQLERVEAGWQKTAGKPVELLPRMKGPAVKTQDGAVLLTGGKELATVTSYRTPVTFRMVLQSDTKDIRIRYAADQIIFNWEMNPDELRIDGGPLSASHQRNFGRLPANEWVGVEMVFLRNELVIYVNGKERFRKAGDFSAVNQPFTIRAHNGDLKLKSVATVR